LANVGYARVSTLDQDLAFQLDALTAAGCTKVFEDRASGARTDRAGLRAALGYVRDGEVLVVWKKAVTPGGQNAQLRGHWAYLSYHMAKLISYQVANRPTSHLIIR